MAYRRGGKSRLLATLVTENRAPCAFCKREVDDEITYGKLYAIGDIQCHYFCVLLSCCLIQKGKDEEGLFGFMYPDILAEIERSKKHKCSYCGKDGATLGCSVGQCRKQFHLPCGREKNAVSLFYGNYKTFCQMHAPKQKIPDHIMAHARMRMKQAKHSNNLKAPKNLSDLKELCGDNSSDDVQASKESICVICYEPVDGFPTRQTFWPPCCARDAWFHRNCLQRMALSAGMHYLKCPLCNDKENFHEAIVSQGFYVPDRDAAWELEQNAFAEIYERPLSCVAEHCQCPMGRNHDAEAGAWDIQLCILCGTEGAHAQCLGAARHVCATCLPAAPQDLDTLATGIEKVMLAERSRSREPTRRGPIMPSRMSLRRTKQRVALDTPSTSQSSTVKTETENQAPDTNVTSSRLELNLKTPRKPTKNPDTNPILEPIVLKDIENRLLSPIKLLEQGLHEKIRCMGVKEIELDSISVVEKIREKFKKPRPLCVKKRIVNDILEGLLCNMSKDNPKTKEPVKEWSSPKKYCDIAAEADEEHLLYSKEPNTETKKQSDIEDDNNKTYLHENNQLSIVTEDYSMTQSPTITPKEETSKEKGDPQNITEVFEVSHKKLEPPKIIEEDTQDFFENTEPENINFEMDAPKIEDESSNSTFQLPPEFIAEHNSDDSLPLFETPKKLKTVEIQKDSSLEISENDQIVNIDVVKMEENAQGDDFIKNLNIKSPVKSKKCAFKFSPVDKESLENSELDIDLESFKNHYLNEVDKDFKCNFSHKHVDNAEKCNFKLKTAIDFAIEATILKEKEDTDPKVDTYPDKMKLKLKRKLQTNDAVAKKKRKTKNNKCVLKYRKKDTDIKLVCSKDRTDTAKDTIDLTIDSTNNRNKKRKHNKLKRKLVKQNIQVKIKWKKEQLKLKITKSQTKRVRKQKQKNLKQYILKYPHNVSTYNNFIVKPEHEVTPKKRKYIKQEKTPDNLVQTSIQSFFKSKIPSAE